MLTNGTTYQTANRLDRFVGFELLVRFSSISSDTFELILCYLLKEVWYQET